MKRSLRSGISLLLAFVFTLLAIPHAAANETVPSPSYGIADILGTYSGTYTASHGVMNIVLSVHNTADLLSDEAALQKYAALATQCASDDKNPQEYTVESVKNTFSQWGEEYIAISYCYPTATTKEPENCIMLSTVVQKEDGSFELIGKKMLQHETYTFADFKNVTFSGDSLDGLVYGNYVEFFWTKYGKVGELHVKKSGAITECRIEFEKTTVTALENNVLILRVRVLNILGNPFSEKAHIEWSDDPANGIVLVQKESWGDNGFEYATAYYRITKYNTTGTVYASLANDQRASCEVKTIPTQGFDLRKHAWPIGNFGDSFSYPDDYAIDNSVYAKVLGLSSVVRIGMNDFKEFINLDTWSGNCIGLSLSSVFNYLGALQLKDYFPDNDGKYLTEYGYHHSYEVNPKDASKGFGLAISSKGNVRSLIEHLQVSQYSDQYANCELLKGASMKDKFQYILQWLEAENPTPLVINLSHGFSAHSVVINSSVKPYPYTMGDGKEYYVVSLYNPNFPYFAGEFDTNHHDIYDYSEQCNLYLCLDDGTWFYDHDPRPSEKAPEGLFWEGDNSNHILNPSLRIYNVSPMAEKILSDELDYLPPAGKTYVYFTGDEVQFQGNTLSFIFDASRTVRDLTGAEFFPFINASPNDATTTLTAKLALENEEITVSGGKNLAAAYRTDDSLVLIHTDDLSEYTVNSENRTVSVTPSENGTFDILLQFINESSECGVRINGSAAGGTFTVSLAEDGTISTDGTPDSFQAWVSAYSDQYVFERTREITDFNELSEKNVNDATAFSTKTTGGNSNVLFLIALLPLLGLVVIVTVAILVIKYIKSQNA